jgi:signal transduction histidine kinase/ligand-binding sensor domain-containing protein
MCHGVSDGPKPVPVRARGRTRATVLSVWTIVAVAAGSVQAQQLSMRQFNVADGLAHDQVTSLLQDSRGYLWAGTFEGLSRFDGSRFVSYSTEDGLGNYVVNGLAEDRQGRLWVATNGGGISLLNDLPASGPRFTSYLPGPGPATNVNEIVVDAAGRLWCGTDSGIYIADVSGSAPVFTAAGFAGKAAVAATAQNERIWMGVNGLGLVEYRGTTPHVHAVPWQAAARFRSIASDGPDAIFVASDAGLFRFTGGRWEAIPVELRPQQFIVGLLPDGAGGAWLATNEGLLHYVAMETRRYSLDRALGGQLASVIADRSGNLWVGLARSGLVRIRSQQIFSYTSVEGLPDIDVTALLEDPHSGMYGITRRGVLAHMIDDRAVPAGGAPSMAVNRRLMPESSGGWWAIGRDGVFHVPGSVPQFDRAARLPLNLAPGLHIPSSIPLLQLDAAGRLWFATTEPAVYRVTNPASSRRRVDRWPLPAWAALSVLGADRAGGVWLGNMAVLARFADGRLTVIDPPKGLTNIQPRDFMLDRNGAVWIGLRFGGVMMTRDPSVPQPSFVRYTIAEGLASDTVWALAEDHDGLIYLGTGRGLDQLDPSTGRVRHFSTDDGLAGNVINDLKVDRHGTVWVASMGGVSRLQLTFAPSRPAPAPIYISRILLAGVNHALPERGAAAVRDLQLTASGRNLRIDFVSPSFQPSGRVRYQYMLAGLDAQWSPPAPESTVNYATLAAGRYRFLVRAVTDDGRTSDEPATVEFIVHPPFWSRPWFIATMFGSVFAGALSVRRIRRERRRTMAAIRRQVATDLHDDVGSGLAQISILSEVAKQGAGRDAERPLDEVAGLARSLRDSMSDIVWAVDPGRDVPGALVDRMRQVTFNLFSSTTDVEFHAPDDRELTRLDLTPDRRRHLLLIFKEAITNIARHAAATNVSIRLAMEPGRLCLTIRDNGLGFDTARRYDGHGLDNLGSRARSIGAELRIESRPREGTLISLFVPLRRRTRMFRWLPMPVRRR